MKKKKLLISVGIVLAIALFATVGIVQSIGDRQGEVDVVQPTTETLSSELLIPGTVELEDVQRMYFDPSLGETIEMHIEEGDEVAEGESLFTYENRTLEIELEQLQIQIESGYLRINHLERQEKALQEQEEELRKEVGREEAEKAVRTEKEQLRLEKRTANLDLRQLLLQKEGLEERTEQLAIVHRGEGTVLSIHDVASEEVKSGQKPIVEIATLDRWELQGKLSEYDTLAVSEGQEVKIQSDAVQGEEWKGTVKEIGFFPLTSDGMPSDGMTEYPITISVDEGPLSLLKPGYQMTLHILTDERTGLTIPTEAIEQDAEGSFVFLFEEGKAVKTYVETGLVERGLIEVRSGLSNTDDVILSEDALFDGMDVIIRD